jgi:large subunit ribosomal protein L32
MVGLPKKKISSARRGQRRSHDFLIAPTLMTCPQCRHPKITHRVCRNCGTYNGIDVLRLESRDK